MPYNTRRKSLSLADLGVIVPKRSRAQSHPSPPSTVAEGDEFERPTKVSKLSHGAAASPAPNSMSPPRTTMVRIKEESPKQELSPPPSPTVEGSTTVNLEGLSDDIVVATIQQLEQTGNRPIFVKELAALLAARLHSVDKYGPFGESVVDRCADLLRRSANPSALISSRLTSYLNRSWPTISPCPLAKDLSPIHPRRLYFYLTTMPKQPVPKYVEPMPKPTRIISPSLSSASAADEDDRYNRNRQALSPSPEVDLSSPELDDEEIQQPPTPGAPFSGRNSATRDRSTSIPNLGSPQLEREEHDFKQTANSLYEQALQRRNSQNSEKQLDSALVDASAGAVDTPGQPIAVDESEESVARKHSEAAAVIFGHMDNLKAMDQQELFSSPVIPAQNALRIDVSSSSATADPLDDSMEHLTLGQNQQRKDARVVEDWETLQSPETVDMAELEDMFDSY